MSPEYFSAVNPQDWPIANCVDMSRKILLEAPRPAPELLFHLRHEAEAAALAGDLSLTWKASCERPGYARVECQIPLSKNLFDQLFNGRSGYRAQFYRSPDCGGAFNLVVIHNLYHAIKIAYAKRLPNVPFEEVERSLLGSWSKVWVVGDGEAFLHAPVALAAPRWVQYWTNKSESQDLGLRIPLPNPPQLELKGTFIELLTHAEWVDEIKISRSMDIYHTGWA